MNVIQTINEITVGNILFPATNALMNRRNILLNYRNFRKTEWYPQEHLIEIQQKNLRELVQYAYYRIPFYRKKFDHIGLRPDDIRNLEDITKIPPLTRQEVIDHHHQMVDNRYLQYAAMADKSSRGTGAPKPFARFRKDQVVRNTSSGSTGAPTIFYEDGTRTGLSWAQELRFRNWFGFGPGTREARLARVSTEYMPNSRDLLFRKYFWNQLALPGVNLAEADYEICHRSLMNFRPKVLWGFTSALTGLAHYIKDQGIDISPYRPGLVITWAAPMYEHEEKILREVFQCHVTNIYGAREVGHIACRCPEGTFHINQENLFVEREKNQTSGTDGSGEILVTTLDITIMPFIRYRMGDIGSISNNECTCGRTLQTLENLLGRTGEIFTTKDGRMISPNFWCRTFMNPALSEKIVRFQVIYRADDDIRVRLVRGYHFDQSTEEGLRKFLDENFSELIRIKFEYVNEIKPQISGKYQMVVNEIQSEG